MNGTFFSERAILPNHRRAELGVYGSGALLGRRAFVPNHVRYGERTTAVFCDTGVELRVSDWSGVPLDHERNRWVPGSPWYLLAHPTSPPFFGVRTEGLFKGRLNACGRGMAHFRLVDDLLLATQLVIGRVACGRRARYVDEPHAHDGVGLGSRGEIHAVDVSDRLGDLGVGLSVGAFGNDLGPTGNSSY